MWKFLFIISILVVNTACTQHAKSAYSSTNSASSASNEQPSQADTSVTIYQEGDNTIEERRVKGFLYSVKVTPRQGKPYYLINADGDNNTLQNTPPKQKIPSWTLFSW